MADSRLIRPLPKPLLLKDYLMEDLSSCSSNGFKSFPRRSQCCTAVRFLHESNHKLYLTFNAPPPPPSKPISKLQTVIAAVKRLQFPSKKSNGSFLPRSFSMKILRKTNFWKRKSERKEIVRWKSFDQLLKEDSISQPSDRSINTTTTTTVSDFTASESGNSSSEAVTMSVEVVSVNGMGETNGDVSTDSTTCSNESAADINLKKQWSSEEKEQFSPVSVLDCPFDDEDEVSSPFEHRLERVEGTKKKLLKKIQMFECLAKLEPMNLSTRFASQPDSDTDSSHSPNEEFVSDIEDEEGEDEKKALALLQRTKASVPSYDLKLKADKLLLDFFRERIGESSDYEGLIEEAEDWINERTPRGSFSYVRDMEKGGKWKTLDEETEEVAVEVEREVFSELLNEELLHMFHQVRI